MPFTLHPRLAADTVEVTRLALCRVLLMKDRRFPWLLLVPEREGVREIAELPPTDRAELIEEISRASDGRPSVAALGGERSRQAGQPQRAAPTRDLSFLG